MNEIKPELQEYGVRKVKHNKRVFPSNPSIRLLSALSALDKSFRRFFEQHRHLRQLGLFQTFSTLCNFPTGSSRLDPLVAKKTDRQEKCNDAERYCET